MKIFVFFFVVTALFFGYVSSLTAQTLQEFRIPTNYSFKNDDDYRRYEPNILECIAYLEKAPVDDVSNYRKRVNSFFLDWLSGTPDVRIVVNSSVMDLCKENGNFLIIFMAGWTKYSLLNNYDDDKFRGYLSGIETILEVYRNGNGVKVDQNILDLMRIQNEDKLGEWVRARI
jgi:hypothetical protein